MRGTCRGTAPRRRDRADPRGRSSPHEDPLVGGPASRPRASARRARRSSLVEDARAAEEPCRPVAEVEDRCSRRRGARSDDDSMSAGLERGVGVRRSVRADRPGRGAGPRRPNTCATRRARTRTEQPVGRPLDHCELRRPSPAIRSAPQHDAAARRPVTPQLARGDIGERRGLRRAATQAGSVRAGGRAAGHPSRRRRRPGCRVRSTYAIRVSVAVPVQRGDRTPGRASVQRTSPSGSSAASSFAPRRDDEAPEGRPARLAVPAEEPLLAVRVDDPDAGVGGDEQPSAARGARRAPAARRSTPTTSRTAVEHGPPGGARERAAEDRERGQGDQPTTQPSAAAHRGTGSRSANAASTTRAGSLAQPRASGTSIRSSSRLTAAPASRRARVADGS